MSNQSNRAARDTGARGGLVSAEKHIYLLVCPKVGAACHADVLLEIANG